jgi:serine palmitoyltransferase
MLEKIPFGKIILRYIKSSHKNDPGRTLFELALFLFALYYFLSSKKKENKSDYIKFTKKEIDELCAEWTPEPLVQEMGILEKWQNKSTPIIHGANGAHVSLKTGEKNVANLATLDFLNLNESQEIKKVAIDVIETSGVGACGPPNFYGTQDVHVRLEEDLAKFLGAELGIIYGQDFVTPGSVIPAFIKRGDLCVVDSGVNIAIQKALIVSRCDIEWYDHNDMEHLEQILTEVKPVVEKQKPLKRRMIVTEAIFANTGELADLPKIVELKNKFKYRLFLDESLSIGAIGKTGRGLAEHYDIPRSEIGITVGSLANSLASSGGFCVGSKVMVHHQRIASNAFVFSASLPPYSAKVGSQAIVEISTKVDSNGDSLLIKDLQAKTKLVFDKLSVIESPYFQISSSAYSPIIHFALRPEFREKLNLPPLYGNTYFLSTGKQSKSLNEFDQYFNGESFLLQKIIDKVLAKSNVLITRTKQILEHVNLPVLPPRLLINLNTGVSEKDLVHLTNILPTIFEEICSKLNNESDFLNLNNEIAQY